MFLVRVREGHPPGSRAWMPGRADFDGRVWSPCLTAALFSSLYGFLASTRAQSSALAGGSQAVPDGSGRAHGAERMKVSGFTFCGNAVRYDYPVVESIRSILPIVDEFIVNVGRCEDGTLGLIRSVGDPKIRIVESVWDESLRKDGLIYSQQTNIALSHCVSDWAFYLQADEVIHEDDLSAIVRAMEVNLNKLEVKGLLFRYLHFVGDYWSTNPWFYHKAVRIIRNNGEVESCGDAVG